MSEETFACRLCFRVFSRSSGRALHERHAHGVFGENCQRRKITPPTFSRGGNFDSAGLLAKYGGDLFPATKQ